MKRNGFTLIELLAVIVVLALLLALAIPAVLNTRENAAGALAKEQEKNLLDAGGLVGVDLDDYMSEIYNCKSGSWIETKCTKDSNKWVSVNLSLDDLKSHGFFSDQQNHCSGSITVTKKTNGEYQTVLNNVSCK